MSGAKWCPGGLTGHGSTYINNKRSDPECLRRIGGDWPRREDMRALFMVHRFPILTETFVLNQITGLIDRGVDVRIFAVSRGDLADVDPAIERYRLLDRLTYLEIPTSSAQRIAQRFGMLASGALRQPKVMARVLNVIRRGSSITWLTLCHTVSTLVAHEPYDIIHGHFGPMGQLAVACRYAGAISGKIVTTFYGYDASSYVKQYGAACYRHLFSDGDLCLAICEPMKQRLIEIGCDPNTIELHRIGIDTNRIKPKPRKPPAGRGARLLSIARLTEKKGLAYALQAVAEIYRDYPGLEYTIVGDGPLRAELEMLAHRSGISDVITWMGSVRHDRAMELMSDADIFLLPSVTGADEDREGTPVVLMEALAQGLPVLSTEHSGIPEIVQNGESGFLVPERDVGALARKLRLLLDSPARWPVMGAAGRASMERTFDINRLNDELLEIYGRILAK
jgi:colanic acid/amylovoran biosynthesis glycosyltransferase